MLIKGTTDVSEVVDKIGSYEGRPANAVTELNLLPTLWLHPMSVARLPVQLDARPWLTLVYRICYVVMFLT